MATVLNLDEVTPQRTEIRKVVAGVARSWSLRDDIPAEVMLPCFDLLDHVRAHAEEPVDTSDPAAALHDVRARLEAQIEETLAVFAMIWRHSYPETTLDELRAWFTHSEREQMTQLFFFRRLNPSSAPSSATTAKQTAEEEAEPAPATNRAARRQTRQQSSGGIPSQKRLSQQLKNAR